MILTAQIQNKQATINISIIAGAMLTAVAEGKIVNKIDCIKPLEDLPIFELITSTAALPLVFNSLSKGI